MKLTVFLLRVWGDWCTGYYWELVHPDTLRTHASGGPYTVQTDASSDAADWAREHDTPFRKE